jgi:spore coat polysaccharide biosynthesis protein SpsF
MERVVIIVQARMSSTRLPGKVLMDVEGIPMLGRVVERARRTEAADEVVVATSRDLSDEPIVGFCETAGIRCARGSHYDVLDRYYTTAQANKADIVVRITADCPLIDSHLIDKVVAILKRLRSADNQDQPVGVGGKGTGGKRACDALSLRGT